ncbi:hypothetical protein ABS71_22805 [bacterium SCN 62-11]|nr:family 16 glycosylhydrolase [Candidatus Eremiobacteraeota bacterium]ODT55525.1 MAG: hypothetical protein ABS71_22805 [bacterium SCN 62-11]
MTKRTVAGALLAITFCGCGQSSSSNATFQNQTQSQSQSTDNTYSVRIVSQPPEGAVQLRTIGSDVEGDPIHTSTQPAVTSLTVQLPPEVTTLRLDYLGAGNEVIATYVQSANNEQEHDFREGILDPPLVLLKNQVQARAEDNPIIGAKFAFAFFGCNEAKVPDEDEEGQLNQNERDSTANVAQLRQHLADIGTLQPKPKYVFLCGDLVQKPTQAGTAELEKELTAWHKIRAYGPIIVNSSGVEETVTPAPDGSVFPTDMQLVAVPGHHEMCYGDEDKPNLQAGEVFTTQMAAYIRGNDGPKPSDAPGDGGLELPPDNVARDESRLSYTFRDGDNLFMVVNTDTYTGPDASGSLPLRWIRQKLNAAQQDANVKHIFVFGHRPIESLTFYRLLNNPLATTAANLKITDPNTKVRGYFCAHQHRMSTLQPDLNGTVQQLISGSGGSQPDTTTPDSSEPYPWFGFGLVGINQNDTVDSAFIGRNVHRHWADQEAFKQRGPNISGPGPVEAKTPKLVARLFPKLLSYLRAEASVTYTSTFESDFSQNSDWQTEEFRDPASSPVEYKKENVEHLAGGGVRLKVAGKHYSESKKQYYYYSGRMRSNFRQKYGLFLWHATVPKGKHIWPALWTAGSVGGNDIWPRTGEIDVMETILSVADRPDFTSRIMTRTNQADFPNYSDYQGNPWYASLPRDDSEEIKTKLSAADWSQPHTFAVDWYQVKTGEAVTDVRYDFYLDVKVDAQGRLVNALDESQPVNRLHSYSLRSLVSNQNQGKPKVPSWETIMSEWSKQAFVINVAVGGAWDPKLNELKKGEWEPPTDGSTDMTVNWVKCYQRSDNP